MIDIFYKSYSKDYKLLKYSLLSLIKNVKGYNNIVILIPQGELDLFNSIVTTLPEKTIVKTVKEEGEGYLFQQYCKLTAHNHCLSEYILYADSDCIFDREIDLNEYIKDDKPEILYTHYSKVGDAICWREPTSKLLRNEQEFEFMRRNCLIYHRATIGRFNHLFPDIKETVLNSKRFSEFNALGAYAFAFEKDIYTFVNTDNWEYTYPKAEQLWSHATKDGSDEHQREYKRMLDVINKTLGLNLLEI